MRHPWANILLIVLVAAERLTGYLGLTHSNPAWFASMRVHRILGFAILALFIWKSETFWFRKVGAQLAQVGPGGAVALLKRRHPADPDPAPQLDPLPDGAKVG
jgi:hypothetical protein